MPDDREGLLLVVSGPSGVGKSTIMRMAMRKEPLEPFYFSISMTTREPREGEIDGIHYSFVSQEVFDRYVEQGGFLEHAVYASHSYGTPLAPVRECIQKGGCAMLDIDVQGARQVKERFPDAVLLFLLPPDFETLERRLRGRGSETEEKIQRRFAIAREECAQRTFFEYTLVNRDAGQAADDLLAIVRAERLKTKRLHGFM